MVKKIEDLNFYELLEVSPSSSSQDIHKAYERIRRIYDPNSIALYSLFSAEETAAIHQRIEDAYRTLMYEGNRRRYDAELREAGEIPEAPVSARPAQRGVSLPAVPAAARETTLPPLPVAEEEPATPFSGEFTGPAIRILREQRKLTIRQVSDRTKIGARYLESIEEENYKKLPARPYLRGFLMLYAKALGYDPDRVTADYLKRYDSATKPKA